MTIRALHMRGEGDEEIDLAGWEPHRMPDDELLWVDATDPTSDDCDAIARALDVGPAITAVLSDMPASPSATVLEGGVASVGVLAPGARPDASHPIGLRIVMGDGWVVTGHRQSIGFLDEHLEQIRDERQVGLLTEAQLLAAILDWLIDAFFRVASHLDDEVDRLDDAALRTDDDLLDRLVRMRREIARARRLVWSHREAFAEILRPDFMPDRESGESAALAAVAQRLERAADAMVNAREMLIGTFDVHMSRTAQRTNEIMKVLTIASVILLPASVLAGVMGMNFQLPFFAEPNMFWMVIGTMGIIGVATLVLARWRGWI